MNHLLPSSMINQRRNDEVFTSSGNSSAFPGDLTPSTQEVEYMMNTVFNMCVITNLKLEVPLTYIWICFV